MLPWLHYRPGALLRTKTVAQSSACLERPTIGEHIDSLQWNGGEISSPVILIDDVFTFGRVSSACRDLLWDASGRDVIVMCLAATRL
jgi:predicted amidophosphoribosyltransferase